ncbi:cell wall anchor protein, partial [Pseudarthrobacter sp. B907]
MHTNLRRGLLGTLFAGGLLALGTSVASAADTTSGSDGLASGTQVIAPVTAPVTLGATSIGLLGDSAATNGGTNPAAPASSTGGSTTSGNDGAASGTQATA